MTDLRRRIPASALGKARLAAVLFGTAASLAQLGNMGNPAHPEAAWSAMSSVAGLLLIGVIVATYIRKRLLPLDQVILPVLVFLGGTGLTDSVATAGLCIAVMVAQSMYGSLRGFLLRSVLLGVAFLSAIAESPYSIGGDRISWQTPAVIAMVPQLALMGVLVRGLYLSLLRQYQASERDAVLAHTGGQLIGATDPEQVRLVSSAAATRLGELSPGAVTLVLECTPEGIKILRGVGIPDSLLGIVLAPDAIGGLDATDRETVHNLTDGLPALQAHAPEIRHWRGIGLATSGADRILLVGGARRVSDDVVNAFRNLGNQVAFAEASSRSHQNLNHQANHDNLTTLPNRAPFFKRLAAAIDEQVPATLLVIDLDDFKQVNDVYGHGAGDELLIEVAARLSEAAGSNGVAARFGGDEFALLLTGVDDGADAIAERLCRRLLEPMRLTAATVTVGASIGVATANLALTAGDLMRCADIAMYSAKARGKNRVERFTTEQHGDLAQHRLLEEHLAHAVERDEIVLHYQPYLDLRTGECIGIEALARWQHPTLGLLPPADFIPMAERTGQVNEVGAHILAIACRQMVGWSLLPGAADLRLAVNVATRQLLDPSFTATVRRVLADTGLGPERLYLEIIENQQLDEKIAQAQLHQLAGMGVRIALDDFGAGDASLATLRSFPIQQIKIDPSFLAQSNDRFHADEMLRLIVSMGEILELETVAEGVETAEQADRLHAANIAYGQGYLLARPMPADQLSDWLTRDRREATAQPEAELSPLPGDAQPLTSAHPMVAG